MKCKNCDGFGVVNTSCFSQVPCPECKPTVQDRYEATVAGGGQSFLTADNALVTVDPTTDRKTVILQITDEAGDTSVIWLTDKDRNRLIQLLSEHHS